MKYWDTGKRGWGEKLKEAAKGQEWVESERLRRYQSLGSFCKWLRAVQQLEAE